MIRNIRINLFSITVILVCVGIVMIYSASSIYAWERYHDGFFFLKRHLVFLAIGIVMTFLVMLSDYKKVRKFAKPLLIFSVLLLALVLLPGVGREVSGARRWFRFKAFSFQPSELANLAMIIYLADFISRKAEEIKTFTRGFLPPLFSLGIVALLILLKPDLGTTLSIAVVAFIMLFVAGARKTHLL